jgi:competence protein ComEC
LAERERWPLWLPVAFAIGIAAYFGLAVEPPAWLGPAGVALTAAACLLGRQRTPLLLVALVAGTAAAGFTAAQVRTAWVAAPVVEKRSSPLMLSGQVLQASPKDRGLRILLQRLVIPAFAPEALPQRVRIKLAKRSEEIRPGDWLRMRAVLLPPPEPAMPGAFDFARRSYFQRLGAVGFALGPPTKLPPPAEAGAGARWSLWWFGLRHRVSQRVTAVLPGEAGAVATALMTGERGRISEEVLQAMRDSGLAHLLAISGLHMGLIAGLLFFGLRAAMALVPRLALYYPIKKWAALGAALGAFAYLFMAGATVPTQRAFLMVSIVLLAVVLDRRAISLRLVAWAAFAVLLVGPEALLSVSFQMSFAAVVALVAGYEALGGHRGSLFAGRGFLAKLGLYLAGLALTSVIANLATAPFAIYHFNRVAVFGLAANLLAVPLTAFWIMPWALAAFALMPLGLEALALVPMSWGLQLLIAVAGEIASWPGAVHLVPAMPLAGLGLIVLGGLWLCLWSQVWRFAGLAAVLAGIIVAAMVRPPDIWVAASGAPMGLRTPEGEMLVSDQRRGRFEVGIWQRRAGTAEARSWPEEGSSDDGRLSCDLLACIYRARGEVVALVRDPRALAEDCALATLLVSQVPLRRISCGTPKVVIDRFDLWRQGAVAIWLGSPDPRVETVRQHRGVRPWAPDKARNSRGRKGE